MLTKACSKKIGYLLKNEFNVQVTVVNKYDENCMSPLLIFEAWKEAFCNSVGSEILNDDKNWYKVVLSGVLGRCELESKGNEIFEELEDYYHDEDVVRIDITKLPEESNTKKTWIIARNKFENKTKTKKQK